LKNRPLSGGIALILLCGIALQAARIMSVTAEQGVSPFLSANDRSRWATVASLVEDGTYIIDKYQQWQDERGRYPWRTIDSVQHRSLDGKQHTFSSKPPLLATIYAGVYLPIFYGLQLRMTDHTYYVARLILLLVNLVPLAIFWWMSARWLQGEVKGRWSRTTMVAFLVFGTFLSTFANTLNNHLPSALAVAASLIPWWRLEKGQSPSGWGHGLAGMAAAFAATCDLPALSWFAMLGVLIFCTSTWKSALWYALGGLPIGVAFTATTYIAHGDLRPPYAHRGVGPEITRIAIESSNSPLAAATSGAAPGPSLAPIRQALQSQSIPVSTSAILRLAKRLGHWELWDETEQRRFAIVRQDGDWSIRHWDDWYDYPGSYWLEENKRGVDRGEPQVGVYAFHLLFGHHGVLSLTPFWLLALAGVFRRFASREPGNVKRTWLIAAITFASLVCLAFYVSRPMVDRNYGGVCSGFRWLFWMIPLWMVPALEGLKMVRSAWTRRLVELALAVSVFSATFPWSNPWTHPWLFQWWSYFGWIAYP
jgi:hypothetical protein